MNELDNQAVSELSKKLDLVNKNLEELKRSKDNLSKFDLAGVGMPLDQMAVLHFKIFLSSLPLAATLFLVGFGFAYMLGWV
ncbi:hypothetical protein [Marinobacter lutaoensis]|uniref:hypothetical protein n=1 Tax=Marinobacter lutaoensis TaxID=135739 RepID=UPI001594623A|nr:hypothetical protein [Marinobacter lutaoensis]NVD34388.1 hypothetical protein [Marinobacter lutaoensis]